ncbi:MAG: HAMP domain-containing histidine kinase [Anaerolineae bacterium]|nr:HAMP domain-containing histidine kinase [Anaerolineae bacterium]
MQDADKITELTEALERERQARIEAEHTTQAVKTSQYEFITLVTHELRVPMTSIKGYTDLLIKGLMGPVNEAQINFLNVIRSNVERMSRMVSDLSDINKIAEERLKLSLAAIQLKPILEDITQTYEDNIAQKNLTLTIQLPETLPNVCADRARLAQILDNLICNAIKYTPEGGCIVVSAKYISEDGDYVDITVRDNGIGILAAEQNRVFEKFFRASDEETRQTPGNGLALHLSKILTEMQGGHIWFESQRGQGTTFHLRMPLDTDATALSMETVDR